MTYSQNLNYVDLGRGRKGVKMPFFIKKYTKTPCFQEKCFFLIQQLGCVYRTIIFDINLYIFERLNGKNSRFGAQKGLKMLVFSDNTPKAAFFLMKNVVLHQSTWGFHNNIPYLT